MTGIGMNALEFLTKKVVDDNYTPPSWSSLEVNIE